MSACIGTPVSWLRLETYARDPRDAAVSEHVAACPACRGCLDEIERDVVALPVLVVPEKRRRLWWPWLLVPAAAAVLLVLLRPRPPHRHGEDTFAVKGVGEVTVGVVRERAGAITFDAREYQPGDRWKVIVTCPPSAGAWVDVTVGSDRPLPTAQLACGNRVYVPGAFTLDGGANRICVHVSAAEGGDGEQGCITIRRE